jgi:hypothetical protein
MAAGSEWEAGPGGMPPGMPGEGYPPAPKSGAVTTVGVLNIVLGVIEVLYCGLLLVAGSWLLGVGKAAQEEILAKGGLTQKQAQEVGGFMGVILGILAVVAIVGLIFAGLRILAGIGVLNRRPWGRTMTIVLASISILLAIIFLLGFNPISLLMFLIYTGYIIASFVILLNAQNAAEFR